VLQPIHAAEVSSRHITRRDAELLDDLAASRLAPLSVAAFDTGWFVQVGSDAAAGFDGTDLIQEYRERELSDEFLAIVAEAQEQGLAYLRIHADGPVMPDLVTFDW
jgi:hypothetical protein